jgi:hypothetical protein
MYGEYLYIYIMEYTGIEIYNLCDQHSDRWYEQTITQQLDPARPGLSS